MAVYKSTTPIGGQVIDLLGIVLNSLDMEIALGCGSLVSVSRRGESDGVGVNVCCDSFDQVAVSVYCAL